MSHPTRSLDELRAALLGHGPWWLREPEEVTDALLTGIAAIFAELENVSGELFDMTFIGTAIGDWLVEHGREHGDSKIEGEDDDTFRARVLGIQERLTKPAILAAVQALLSRGVVVMEEKTLDGAFLIPEGQPAPHGTWLDLVTLLDSANAFRLLIPRQEPPVFDTGFIGADGDGWEDSRAFLVPEDGGGPYPTAGLFTEADTPFASSVYAQIARVVREMRAAGVFARLELV